MRIIAGKYKGIILNLPKGKETRPLKDRVRESIFNLLIHSKKILLQLEKSNVLDLYSGTGSFGLECLSRGVQKVIFIEKNKIAIKILEKNIAKLKVGNKIKIFPQDVFNLVKTHDRLFHSNPFNFKYDLIFCDPPFKDTNINQLIELIFKKNLLKKSGIIILHRPKNSNEKLSNYLKVVEERDYGISKIIFGEINQSLS